MAVSKHVLRAIKAASFIHIDIQNNYQKVRRMYNAAHMFRGNINDEYIFNDTAIADVPVRIFYPDNSESNDVIIFFHGGGWVIGNVENYSNMCSVLCRKTGMRVISVDYRLAPEHKFPAGLNDCFSVVKAVSEWQDNADIKAERIILAGDSAGGNLSAAVSIMAKDTDIKINSQILLYPAVNNDYTENSPFKSVTEYGKDYFLTSERLCGYMELYISNPDDYNNPLLAPILYDRFENMPDTLVITAQYDPLHDEGMAFAEKLRTYGNYVESYCIEDALHGFITLPADWDIVTEAYRYIKNFLDRDGGNEQRKEMV